MSDVKGGLRKGDVVRIINVDNAEDPDIIRTKCKVGRIMDIDGSGEGDEAYFVEFSTKEEDGFWYSLEDLQLTDDKEFRQFNAGDDILKYYDMQTNHLTISMLNLQQRIEQLERQMKYAEKSIEDLERKELK